MAGTDISNFKPHSTRGRSTSKANTWKAIGNHAKISKRSIVHKWLLKKYLLNLCLEYVVRVWHVYKKL